MPRKPEDHKPHQPDAEAKFWRLPAVMAYTQRSKTAIYRDTTFPKPVKLGPNTSAWLAAEVRAWCDQRAAQREVTA
ncbi:helix-turn-helix transcriptional regulator [Arenimonas sp.]|uniref:helix-turn-helix transcriptional regulator n=1 Tax=Arenimonas sp. TaxID=1872635 RepID=UPI0035B368DC